MIKFKTRVEPRTEDGGFGRSECAKCGTKVTTYLEFHLYTTYVLICMGCLQDGIDMICDTILDSCVKKEKEV